MLTSRQQLNHVHRRACWGLGSSGGSGPGQGAGHHCHCLCLSNENRVDYALPLAIPIYRSGTQRSALGYLSFPTKSFFFFSPYILWKGVFVLLVMHAFFTLASLFLLAGQGQFSHRLPLVCRLSCYLSCFVIDSRWGFSWHHRCYPVPQCQRHLPLDRRGSISSIIAFQFLNVTSVRVSARMQPLRSVYVLHSHIPVSGI
jgi:hypothetical protein